MLLTVVDSLFFYCKDSKETKQDGVLDIMADNSGGDPENLELKMTMGFSGKRVLFYGCFRCKKLLIDLIMLNFSVRWRCRGLPVCLTNRKKEFTNGSLLYGRPA